MKDLMKDMKNDLKLLQELILDSELSDLKATIVIAVIERLTAVNEQLLSQVDKLQVMQYQNCHQTDCTGIYLQLGFDAKGMLVCNECGDMALQLEESQDESDTPNHNCLLTDCT